MEQAILSLIAPKYDKDTQLILSAAEVRDYFYRTRIKDFYLIEITRLIYYRLFNQYFSSFRK